MSSKIRSLSKTLFNTRRGLLPLALILCLSVAGVFASHAVYSYFLAASISVNTPSVTEGEGTSGTVLLNFTVTLSGTRTDPTQPVTVDFTTGNTTVGSSPATAGVDYVVQNGTLSFAVGETSKTIAVVVNKDCTVEPTEYLGIVLSNPINAAVSGSNFYGVINTDDIRSFNFSNGIGVTEGEGTSGTTLLNMPVTLSGSPVTADTVSQCGGVAVDFATANTTIGGSPATAGVDYVAQSGSFSFAVGETSKTIAVVVNKDCTAEATEYLGIVFSNPINATISGSNFYGVINTDDIRSFNFSNGIGVTEGEGTSGTTLLNMPVTLSGSPVTADTVSQCGGVAVDFATANTTIGGSPATAGVDYVAQSGSFSFAVGETSKTIAVVVNKDCTAEATEYLGIVFSNPINATISGSNFYGVINTDDIRSFNFSNGIGVTEGEGTSGTTLLNMPVTLSGSPVTADTVSQCSGVAVDFATANTTIGGSPATAGVDYVAQSGSFSFAVGETSKTIAVVVNKDCTAEATEYLGIVFSNPINATISGSNFYGVINTDDSRQFSFPNGIGVAEGEGTSGTTLLNMPVALSGSPVTADTVSQCGGVAVDFATGNTTVGSSPATAGVDYVAQSGSFSFGVGETSKTIAVVVNKDCTAEATEYFGIVLSNPTNAVISGSNFYGAINTDDSRQFFFNNGTTVAEGNAVTVNLNMPVTLSGSPVIADTVSQCGGVSVDFATGNTTVGNSPATAGVDYVAQNGSFSFGVGETSKTIAVVVNPDCIPEPTEYLGIVFSNPTNAVVNGSNFYGGITNTASGCLQVTNGANTGTGSLRQALDQANSNADSNIITFNFAGTGPFVIAPTTPLPAFTTPVTIDGFSQPGSSVNTDPQGNNAVLLIEIDGTNAGAGVNGLTLNGSNSSVRGLVINRFSGNGIALNTNNNSVEGNFIGTDSTGTLNRSNGQNGILINATSNNIIGGTGASVRNTIAFNGEDGIRVQNGGTGNLISRNSIHSNGTTNLHLGIDLQGTDGITENDQNDPDTGTNNLQNYPVIISATQSNSRVIGILNSTPSTNFRLEFFNSPTQYSSGKTFVGAFDVTTNASGYANFDQTFTGVNSPFGSWMTATATRLTGQFDTSELSYPKQVAFIPTAASVNVGGRVMSAAGRGIFGARIALTEANGNVRYATTNPFGYYRFVEVSVGSLYVFNVESKNHKFAQPQRIITINEETDTINFVAIE